MNKKLLVGFIAFIACGLLQAHPYWRIFAADKPNPVVEALIKAQDETVYNCGNAEEKKARAQRIYEALLYCSNHRKNKLVMPVGLSTPEDDEIMDQCIHGLVLLDWLADEKKEWAKTQNMVIENYNLEMIRNDTLSGRLK